jgi:uncharacterized DUF497 family protein
MVNPDFEWDEAKRLINLAKYGLDFRDAAKVLSRPTFTLASPRGDEERWFSVGWPDAGFVTVVRTPREGRVRVISMRRARRAEERQHRQLHG